MEADVVIQGHLIHDVISPNVLVVVISIWSSNNCPCQDVRVWSRSVQLVKVAACWRIRTRRAAVMWSLRVFGAVACGARIFLVVLAY